MQFSDVIKSEKKAWSKEDSVEHQIHYWRSKRDTELAYLAGLLAEEYRETGTDGEAQHHQHDPETQAVTDAKTSQNQWKGIPIAGTSLLASLRHGMLLTFDRFSLAWYTAMGGMV